MSVLDESGGFSGPLDFVVTGGCITAVERNEAADGATEPDFSGLWIMPGAIDCHEHVAGPRTQVAVVLISQTGGHADGFLP